jgi:hypothetical protein
MSIPALLLSLAIAVLVVAAVWLMRRSKAGNVKAGRAAGLCAVVAIVLVVVRLVFVPFGSPPIDAKAILAAHERYQAACGEVLAAHLVARYPGAQVVVLTDPNASSDAGSQALLDKLDDGLKQGGLSVTRKTVEIPESAEALLTLPDDPTLTPEMKSEYERMMRSDTSMWFDAAALNDIVVGLRDQADVVISTVSLVQPLEPASLPSKGQGPALVLFDAYVPDMDSLLQELFDRTALDTLVNYRADAGALELDKIPDDPQAAFNQRFVLEAAGR